VAVVALLWNILGVLAFFGELTMSEESLAQMDPPLAELYRNWPKWPLAGTALGVFAGVGGSVGLLLKRRWATPVFAASLVGLVVQNIHPFLLSDYLSVAGPSAAVLPAVVFVIAIALLVLSRWATSREWLR
jgi:hypothetical protein